MVRKIRKSPLAFPLLDQDSTDAVKDFREREKASALNGVSRARTETRAVLNVTLDVPPSRRECAAFLAETNIGEHIARELRGIYEPVVSQPTPDRFIELLNQLEAGAIYCRKTRPGEKK